MRLIDADALLETIEDHVTTVSCCLTVDWSRGKTQMKEQVIEDIRNAPTIGCWISVKDRLPEQHNSMFAPWFNSHKWANAMWYEESDRVIVTMRFPDGTRAVSTAKLYDGKWKTDVGRSLNPVITHWQPFPELPKENE